MILRTKSSDRRRQCVAVDVRSGGGIGAIHRHEVDLRFIEVPHHIDDHMRGGIGIQREAAVLTAEIHQIRDHLVVDDLSGGVIQTRCERPGASGHEHREVPGCKRVDHRCVHHQRSRSGGQTAIAVAAALRQEGCAAAEEIARLIRQDRTARKPRVRDATGRDRREDIVLVELAEEARCRTRPLRVRQRHAEQRIVHFFEGPRTRRIPQMADRGAREPRHHLVRPHAHIAPILPADHTRPVHHDLVGQAPALGARLGIRSGQHRGGAEKNHCCGDQYQSAHVYS